MAARKDVRKLSLLEKAVEAAPDGIAVMDDAYRFIYANTRYLELFGIDRGEALIGEDWRVAHPDREHEFIENEVLRDVRRYGDWRGEVIAVDEKGRSRRVELSIKDVEDATVWFARVAANDTESFREPRRQS